MAVSASVQSFTFRRDSQWRRAEAALIVPTCVPNKNHEIQFSASTLLACVPNLDSFKSNTAIKKNIRLQIWTI